MKILKADVVVVGSGGAGLCAAAAAARAGARVVVVTKGRAGLANATAWAGGGFTVSPPSPGPGTLTPEEHFRLSLETGRHIADPELLGELCWQGPRALEELERDYGVRLDWGPGGCSVGRYGRPPMMAGVGLTRPLLDFLRRAGVPIVEETVVAEVVVDDGRAAGVLGVDLGAGCLLAVEAPAVVVATGGGGAIYGRTDNPPRLTGDGYALLEAAGARLVHMEFVQFYPLGVAEPGVPARLLDAGLLDYVRLTDETGAGPLAGRLEEWGLESGDEVNLFARDRAAVALARHIAEGHELYLHTEELDRPGVDPEVVRWLLAGLPRSLDPLRRPLRVAPTQHYFCGGAAIDRRGRVRRPDGEVIPGLFAGGETTGGVDGANRVGGNALTNIVVFGLAAGKAAAEEARRVSAASAGEVRAEATARLRERLEAWGVAVGADGSLRPGSRAALGAGPGRVAPGPVELRKLLAETADRFLGPVRRADTLERALAELGELGRAAAETPCRTPSELLLAFELGAGVRTATLVAQAALGRRESRGPHFREDYPREDPALTRPPWGTGS
ncbi:MAG: FAD-dependent oxidoreductase [Firmicutes bacterium]|nr:FAD-dependent oxidoreductase [Bacillota bacterium]